MKVKDPARYYGYMWGQSYARADTRNANCDQATLDKAIWDRFIQYLDKCTGSIRSNELKALYKFCAGFRYGFNSWKQRDDLDFFRVYKNVFFWSLLIG